MLGTEEGDHDPVLVERARRAYLAAVSYVDDQIGRLLAVLAETSLDRDTVIVVTADHGDMLGERGLWYKMSFFEGSARVPLLVHAPRRFAPRRVPQVVSHVDLLPTLATLAGASQGLDEADALDGVSLLPALLGAGPAPDRALAEYLAEGATSPCVMVRRGPLKYIHCPRDPDLLYDLEQDPLELASLTDEARLAAFRAEVGARWDLADLRRQVVASQRRRRQTARALAIGEQASWDWPPAPGQRGFIGTGQDFWETLEAARAPAES
jgi:choline-sulfatase